MREILQAGITGTGGIAAAHAAAYKPNQQVELVACCDIDTARAEAFAAQWGLRAYPSQEAMLEAESLDIISLCTQPRSHRALAVAAFEAGANVLSEKPLATSSEEGRAMVEAARAAGKLLMVAVCHRFHEPLVRARAMLAEGKLGALRGYHNAFVGRVPTYKDRGGVLLDNGSHAVDFYRHLVGEPGRVSATINPRSDDITDATEVWALVESVDGVPGTINLSFDVQGGANLCALYGSEGTAVIDYDSWNLRYKLGSADWVAESSDLPGDHRFHREIAHFAQCVLTGNEPGPNGEEGVRDLELIEAIWRAARGC